MGNGKFVLSLDFELHWGAVEKWDLKLEREYFESTRQGIPLILNLFNKFNIHATWATVGFLFAKNRGQLMEFSPKHKPSYINKILNYYDLIDSGKIGWDENEDPYHYAPSLISKIIETPNQELATHTFSHYYCNEPGQNINQFEADLKAAQNISKENFDIELQSLVFPRNQFNSEYLEIARRNGIKVVRSNPNVWFWRRTSKAMAFARAFDTLLPISGSLSFEEELKKNKSGLLLLPASRFLRPYSKKERYLQYFKFRRIKEEMTHAAKNNEIYHLWWHPHNFGNSLDVNMEYLEKILNHFEKLKKEFGFCSKSMIEMY